MLATALRSKGYKNPYVTMDDATVDYGSPVYRFSKKVEKITEDHQHGVIPKPFTCTLERIPERKKRNE